MTNPPKLFVSACLEAIPCRYDGEALEPFWSKKFHDLFEVIALCPEQEAGMTTPRPEMTFIQKSDRVELAVDESNRDLSCQLFSTALRIMLDLTGLDGAIVKSKSPSCAVDDCKVFTDKNRHNQIGLTEGIFTGVLKKKFPHLPIIDEQELVNPQKRISFFIQVIQTSQVNQIVTWEQAQDFHLKQKYFLDLFKRENLKGLEQAFALRDLKIYQAGFKKLIWNFKVRQGDLNLKAFSEKLKGLIALEQVFAKK
ncbi:MAG: DUF523 domain-containing protein [SAR324 cluster bacterium]|nr:DUF523 domain-containing protein [SAR324 cluster bacterium]